MQANPSLQLEPELHAPMEPVGMAPAVIYMTFCTILRIKDGYR
jgi:hypothetical protein